MYTVVRRGGPKDVIRYRPTLQHETLPRLIPLPSYGRMFVYLTDLQKLRALLGEKRLTQFGACFVLWELMWMMVQLLGIYPLGLIILYDRHPPAEFVVILGRLLITWP